MMILRKILAFFASLPRLVYSFITREKLFYPFLIVSFLLLNLFFIGHRVRFVMLGDRLDELNKELSVASSLNQRLEKEVVNLSSLPRIEQVARDSCGMVIAEYDERVFVSWDGEKNIDNTQETMVERAVCVIQKRADDLILPDKDFVKGY